jgi:yecA family protein
MTVDYVACREALERAHAALDPSECHGVLCGLLCATRQFPEERWLDEVLQPGGTGGAESVRCKKILRSSRRETERQLEGQQFDFEPMLPDEEVPLTQRGEALTLWCRGFLYGLAVGGLDDSKFTSEDVREVLKDLSEFTQLDVSDLEAGTNALERDYAELVEYVRVGVMLIHTSLREREETPPGGEQLH